MIKTWKEQIRTIEVVWLVRIIGSHSLPVWPSYKVHNLRVRNPTVSIILRVGKVVDGWASVILRLLECGTDQCQLFWDSERAIIPGSDMLRVWECHTNSDTYAESVRVPCFHVRCAESVRVGDWPGRRWEKAPTGPVQSCAFSPGSFAPLNLGGGRGMRRED